MDLGDDITRPLFRGEFRELIAAPIPTPRRNYSQRDGYISSLRPKAAGVPSTDRKSVDLSPSDLAKGRKRSAAKRRTAQ